METRVQKWGNSFALRLPKPFAIQMGLERNSPVELSLVDGKLVIALIVEPLPGLGELLAQVTAHNLHGEVDTGPAMGGEAW
jgi:antitoxin MazE